MTNHLCHAIGCQKKIPPKLLMCATHWRLVPVGLKGEIWKHYRPGQEKDKQPSLEYLHAMCQAILVVRVVDEAASFLVGHPKVAVTTDTPEGVCDFCKKKDELRPYGPNGESICFGCAMKDEETTKKRFNQIAFGEDYDA